MRGTWQFTFAATITTLLLAPALTFADDAAIVRGRALFSELGCASCHTDPGGESSLRERTPDLSSAGLRYQPAYLFGFLQKPERVKRHLGAARMPGFQLTEREALALTLFLETQRTVSPGGPPLPKEVREMSAAKPQAVSRAQFDAELAGGLICLTCHALDGRGGVLGIELSSVGHRLQASWVKEYLAAPAMFGVPPATMPPQFYQPSADGQSYLEVMPRAAERIQIIADHLASLNSEQRAAQEKRFLAARAAFPGITAASGETLFKAFNCTACHRHASIVPRTDAAPELSSEGQRAKLDWLEAFLRHPIPIRPFGYHPGDASRMPDFHLTDREGSDLSAFLSVQKTNLPITNRFQVRPLTAFAQRKATLLLTEKLSCLGCHQFGERGGRIGPNLTDVAARRQPGYIFDIIRDPRSVAPHSIMPRLPLTTETVELLANFLVQQTPSLIGNTYLSALDHPIVAHEADTVLTSSGTAGARRNYLTYCAGCHGGEGHGDGFNAAFLPTRPTVHADARYLATRPDDTLFDGIHAGGAVLNKSHFMPAWGGTLSANEIRDLVAHLRALCRCSGPAWSKDDSPNP